MLQCFFGHDERTEAGTTVFLRSAIAHASKPIALIPITRRGSIGVQEGTTAFTFRRFLIPWMMQWTGVALFVDGADMLCRADLNELAEHFDYWSAVQVVKHDYRTKHPRKYVGSSMEADNTDYPRKQWTSVMLINCAHFAWRNVTPQYVADASPLHLLQLDFMPPDRIGPLPATWNWLVDEQGENADAKLLHFTAGIPGFDSCAAAPMADEWHKALTAATKVLA